MPLHPLRFEPIYKPKVWGGRRMERLGRTLPTGAIGESWELADLSATSPSGGGGDAARSVVADGPLKGRTLGSLVQAFGKALTGRLPLAASGEFPLLVKFLDAQENLSVQVHPSPGYAAAHPSAHLKSEAWYIIDCEPGSVIYKGVEAGVTPQLLSRAIETNSVEAVEPLMLKLAVKPGDCHYLPSGTLHALGEGILVAEVQTPSDTTFRVFDWGRTGRELHVEQALQCIHLGPADTRAFEQRRTLVGDHTVTTSLCQCPFFAMDEVTPRGEGVLDVDHDQPLVWMVLAGSGRFQQGDLHLPFRGGQTWLLPPDLGAQAHVSADAKWIEVSFPQTKPKSLA